MFDELVKELKKNNIVLEEGKINKLEEYWNLLLQYNKSMHLFSRKLQEHELKKQFYDVILLDVFLPDYDELVDAGSGAGFVGLILGILNPERRYVLVERSVKKGDFLQIAAFKLKLENIAVLKQDIREFEREADVVVSKASCMRNLLERRLTKILRVGGMLVHFSSSPLSSPYKNYPYRNPFRNNNSYIAVLKRVI